MFTNCVRFYLGLAAASSLSLAWAQRPPVNESPAGPVIYRNRVLNAASLRPIGLPGSGIARGAVFSIFGARLGPAAPGVQATAFPLSTSLAGVSVVFSRGSLSYNAWPVLVSDGQINAIAPSAMPPGRYSLRINVGERASNPMPVQVVDRAPGIFTEAGTGMGPAVASAVATPRGGSLFGRASAKALDAAAATTPVREMRPGQLAALWVTGLGPIQGADNQRSTVQVLTGAEDIDIWVGGVRVPTAPFGGRTLPGIDQLIFPIPAGAPQGCFVPVQIRTGGTVSNAATLAIVSGDGQQKCADPHSPVAEMALGGGPSVAVLLYRGTRGPQPGTRDAALVADKAIARAITEQSPTGQFDPYLAPPPPGSCTAYSAHGDILRGAIAPAATGRPLNVGGIRVGNGRTERELAPVADLPGYFYSVLGGGLGDPKTPPDPLFFDPTDDGTATVSVAGDADGKLAATANSLAPAVRFERHNLPQFLLLDRARRTALNWDLTGEAQVAVFGAAYDRPSNASTLFFCMAPRGASEFVIPYYVLSQLPASRSQAALTEGTLILATFPDATAISANGQALHARQEIAVQPLTAVR